MEDFTFSKEEINNIEQVYIKDNSLREYIYIYIYIGEAVIHILGGFWFIGKFKGDSAYGLPIILGRRGIDKAPRILPDAWLDYIDIKELGKPLGDFIYSLQV